MKFSIRDLFLVTVIVALALGWWVDHRQLASDRDGIAKEIRGRDIIVFKASALEQLLKDRGVTVDVPSPGTLIITEKGLTEELHYKW